MKPAANENNSKPRANRILAALPRTSHEWLHRLEPVTLRQGMVLYEPDEPIEHVYFPGGGLISIISMNSEGATHRVLLHYINALVVQIAQTAVCNKFHSVEERFCRWLLMAHDRSATDTLPMTQEALARVLGSLRASVVAAGFQKKGAIRYSRGLIRILDRKYLESTSCECYGTISAAHSKIDA